MSKEGVPNIPKPLIERESAASVPDREQELRAEIEEIKEAESGFHGSVDSGRRMSHRLVASRHRKEDELAALAVPSVAGESEKQVAVEAATERMSELGRRIQRQRDILGTIPEDSRIRRAPQETLLARYEKELEGLKKESQTPGSVNSERRIQTLRDRMAFTEGLIASASDSKLEKIHEATLLRDKVELEALEKARSTEEEKSYVIPQVAEFPAESDIVSPEELIRASAAQKQAEKPVPAAVPEKPLQSGTHFGPEDVISVLNARREKGVTASKSAPTPTEKTIENKTASPSPEALDSIKSPKVPEEVAHTLSPDAVRSFEKTFGITKEDLASVEGFDRLSSEQQKFIFENLSQVALGNIEEESARIVSEKGGQRKSETVGNYKRLLNIVLSPARDVMNGYAELKTKKQAVENLRTSGILEHGDILRMLVDDMVKHGPAVKADKDGNPVIDLINIQMEPQNRTLRNAMRLADFEFNAAAHALAKTPAGWRATVDIEEDGAMARVRRFFREKAPALGNRGKVQENTYAKRETEYNAAKERLAEVLKMNGASDLQIAEALIGVDSRVHQLQTLRTNPDAVGELAHISDQSFSVELAKRFFTGNGGYMALGAVGRTLGGAAFGFLGAPVAAGGLAYLRSWNRTAAELRERDRNARAGARDTKAGALNVVAAEMAEQTVFVNGKEMQNGLTAKLQRLVERAKNAEGDTKKKLLAQLRSRVEYVNDKQRLQRIDYGNTKGKVSRQVALTGALGEALAYLSAEDMADGVETTARAGATKIRLAQKLDRTEEMLVEARRDARKKELKNSVVTAAGFSVAGALIADYFRDDSAVRGFVGAEATPSAPEAAASGSSAPYEATEGAPNPEAAPTAPSPEAIAPYAIRQGDTLWDILSQKTSLTELGETRARENAVANIIKSLSAGELQEIGITSGDARKIYPGDTINMEKLSALITEHKSIIENARARFGTLPIDTDPTQIIPTQPEK